MELYNCCKGAIIYPHSISRPFAPQELPLLWETFRLASQGGGSPPEWTERKRPMEWAKAQPADSAGELWARGPGFAPRSHPVAAMIAASYDGEQGSSLVAYYRSSGGQFVIVLQMERGTDEETWYLVIARPEEAPRLGCREDMSPEACWVLL